jgi:hypothetical protein
MVCTVVVGGFLFMSMSCSRLPGTPHTLTSEDYNPEIDPAHFTTTISNKYINLPIGKEMVYEAQTAEGLERIEIAITGETKMVMGIETLVYHDREWLNDELVEDTMDWLAQDKDGNVWYFGEAVNNYENGVLTDHEGSWEAGVDGAKPGIWITGNPQIGDTYRQEYYVGEAEDIVEVVDVNVSVTTRMGTFNNCIKTFDFTPLDSQSKEHKYYCPELGSLVLIEHLVDGDRVELVEVNYE